ncbi:MAG: hypothetical protein JW827_00410 [Spirochaetes bacterium]|nr:hypothetical protein [Spirochaetota bacterium]
MKKLGLLLTVLLLIVGLTTFASAQSTGDIYLNITIVDAGLNIQSQFPDVTWGVTNGGYNVSTSNQKGTIQNTGSVTVDLSVRCSATSWGISTDLTPTATEFVLQGLFCTWNAALTTANFGVEDIIDGTYAAADDNNNFAIVADPDYVKGYNMPPSQVVNMRFALLPPSSASSGDTQQITVTVQASAH